jgi:hypothetical protein
MVGISSLRFATCNTGVCAVQVSLDFWYLNPNKMKTRQNSKNHWLYSLWWIPYVLKFYDVYLSLFCCENGCVMINEVMEEWHSRG